MFPDKEGRIGAENLAAYQILKTIDLLILRDTGSIYYVAACTRYAAFTMCKNILLQFWKWCLIQIHAVWELCSPEIVWKENYVSARIRVQKKVQKDWLLPNDLICTTEFL